MTAADLAVSEPRPRATYERMLAEAKIPFQLCTECRRPVFYPRVLCPACGSTELEWRESAGVGTVYSSTFVPHRDGGGYHVLLVDLDEGFRLMASAVDDAVEMPIGSRVSGSVVIERDGSADEPRIAFERVED